MKARTIGAVAALALTTLLAASARAAEGVLIVQKTTIGERSRTHEIQIEANRMRTESTTPTGDRRTVIFDGSKQLLWVIDDAKKTYSELTRADAERFGSQIAGAMSQLQERLKGMPPEQRAQFEKMMQGRGGMPGAPGAKPEYRKVGTDKVGSWSCTRYDGYVNGQKTSELCTVDPKVLGFGMADFAVTEQMADFFGKLIPGGGDRMFRIGNAAAQGFEGVPVRTVQLGSQTIVSEMEKASRQSFADATFALPTGYTRQEFLPGGGAAPGGAPKKP